MRGKAPGSGSGLLGWVQLLDNNGGTRWDYVQWIAHPQQDSRCTRAEFLLGQSIGFPQSHPLLLGSFYQAGWLQQKASQKQGALKEGILLRCASIGGWSPLGYLEYEWDRANATALDGKETELAGGSHHLRCGGCSFVRKSVQWSCDADKGLPLAVERSAEKSFLLQGTWTLWLTRAGPKAPTQGAADWCCSTGFQWQLGVSKSRKKVPAKV